MVNENYSVIFDPFRAFRSLVIASKMMNYFFEQNDPIRANRAFILGYVHDIGYFLGADEEDHHRIGAEILKAANYDYFKEVYYHGTGSNNYYSEELLLLELADITTTDDGRHVRISEALENLRSVYGESSAEYKNFIGRLSYLEMNCNPDTLISIRDYFNSLAGGKLRGEVRTLEAEKLGSFFDDEDATVFTYEDLMFDEKMSD